MPNKNKRRGGRSKVKNPSKRRALVEQEVEALRDIKSIEAIPPTNRRETIENTEQKGELSVTKTNIPRRRETSKRKITEKLHYFLVFNPKFPFHKGTVTNNHDLRKLSLTLVQSADLLTDTSTLKLRVRRIEDFNNQKVILVKITSLPQPSTATVDYDSDVVILD